LHVAYDDVPVLTSAGYLLSQGYPRGAKEKGPSAEHPASALSHHSKLLAKKTTLKRKSRGLKPQATRPKVRNTALQSN